MGEFDFLLMINFISTFMQIFAQALVVSVLTLMVKKYRFKTRRKKTIK